MSNVTGWSLIKWMASGPRALYPRIPEESIAEEPEVLIPTEPTLLYEMFDPDVFRTYANMMQAAMANQCEIRFTLHETRIHVDRPVITLVQIRM